jgi:hypothetical protein
MCLSDEILRKVAFVTFGREDVGRAQKDSNEIELKAA